MNHPRNHSFLPLAGVTGLSHLARKSRSRASVVALTAICALAFTCESYAVIVFADTFDRGVNSTNLNVNNTGKSGTLGALNWNERVTADGTETAGDAEILSNQLNMNSGAPNAISSNVPYVDHNFIGYTSFTVAFDFVSVVTPSGGSIRQLGFGIGNTKAALDALSSSGALGDIRISYDLATTQGVADPVHLVGQTGVQIIEAGGSTTYVTRTIASGDTLSATFTFADMNAGTTINYEVFHEGVSIHTGDHIWSGTNQNYIGLFNSHRNATGNDNIIDNFSIDAVPEPSAALLGGLGMLLLLRRRR